MTETVHEQAARLAQREKYNVLLWALRDGGIYTLAGHGLHLRRKALRTLPELAEEVDDRHWRLTPLGVEVATAMQAIKEQPKPRRGGRAKPRRKRAAAPPPPPRETPPLSPRAERTRAILRAYESRVRKEASS